jgi:hypothetical protein
VWVGKIYRHAKIIIYVCSTVCGGGGGGAGGDIDLVNMWGSWRGEGGGNIGGGDMGQGENRGENAGFGPTPQRIYICCYY